MLNWFWALSSSSPNECQKTNLELCVLWNKLVYSCIWLSLVIAIMILSNGVWLKTHNVHFVKNKHMNSQVPVQLKAVTDFHLYGTSTWPNMFSNFFPSVK